MKLLSLVVALIITTTFLQSCSNMNKQGSGTLIGGGAGALIGSRFGKGEGALLATGIGALAGALIGNQIGKNMDDQDREIAERTAQQALEASPSGQRVAWKNPDSGHRGVIIPQKASKNASGQYCREYTHSVIIGGKTEQAYGKACRQPDGAWKIVR